MVPTGGCWPAPISVPGAPSSRTWPVTFVSTPGTTVFWSSDGRLAVAGAARTAVLDAQGHVLQRLDGVARAWSPDGHLLALVRGTAVVLAQPGRSVADRVLVAHAGNQVGWLQFTPDGRDLGYSDANGALLLTAVAGGPARELATGTQAIWSRDDRLAFIVVSGTTAAVEIGDRLGHGARVVARLPFDDHGIFTTAWLGDGSRLLANVFTRDHADLWAMNADGGAQRRLTNTGERIGEPAWSPDGATLAYSAAPFSGGLCGYCGGSVALADPSGGKLSLVPGPNGSESEDTSPSWSPAGRRSPSPTHSTAGCSRSDRRQRPHAARTRRRRVARLVSRRHHGGVRRLVRSAVPSGASTRPAPMRGGCSLTRA